MYSYKNTTHFEYSRKKKNHNVQTEKVHVTQIVLEVFRIDNQIKDTVEVLHIMISD